MLEIHTLSLSIFIVASPGGAVGFMRVVPLQRSRLFIYSLHNGGWKSLMPAGGLSLNKPSAGLPTPSTGHHRHLDKHHAAQADNNLQRGIFFEELNSDHASMQHSNKSGKSVQQLQMGISPNINGDMRQRD